MRRYGAKGVTLTAAQSVAGARLVGGPVILRGWSLNDGVQSGGQTVDQSATAPAAGATIASISLANGTYQVAWTLELTGTPGAGDADNVQVFIGATQVATSANAGAVGTYPQEETQVTVVSGPLTLAFKANGAGTVGAVYKIEANITPINDSTATVFDGGQAVGFVDMDNGGGQNVWFGEPGVAVDTELRVQTTLGTVQGVVYYGMCYPEDS